MRITDFDLYKNLLKEKSGLVLPPDKSYLLDSRLSPIAKKWGYPSLEALTKALQGVPDKDLVNDIVESMTTNETSFFRDSRPFDLFKDFVLPYILEKRAGQKQMKIWCAAASSGQEPYSLSMILKDLEATGFQGWDTDILATDISNEITEQARDGIYSQFEAQRGLPIQMLMKYFTQIDDKWQIKDEIRQMVRYDIFNLLDDMAGLGTFDIIFCRNVLVYFDKATKTQVLGKLARQLAPDGFLFIGETETTSGISDDFVPLPDKRDLCVHKDSVHLNKETGETAQALA